MDADRQARQKRLLAGLLGVLALVLLWQWWTWDRPGDAAGPPPAAPPGTAAAGETGEPFEGDVNLAALDAPRPAPSDGARNPFEFARVEQPRAEPDPAPQVARTPRAPAAPAGPPPIPLKFVGTVSKDAWPGKYAVLSDGKNVYHGTQGEIIDGRFRIVQIGEESIQLEYADGRGRQTIRLAVQ